MPGTWPRASTSSSPAIEKSDKESLYVTDVRNTQLQVKIGPYVDTFLAQLVMAELKGKMQEDQSEKRLLAAFDKTMAKIAKHQKADGNFDKNDAWASTLSMALCSKGINRAAQRGFAVPRDGTGRPAAGERQRPGRRQGDVHRTRRFGSRLGERGGRAEARATATPSQRRRRRDL